ncbi:MAG: hypothetical protein K0R41_757 [Geminicoccaceae bacterium]|nr:hypothetical protein [Rhizobiaceae bacterium]MCE3246932.1 hypothetical protein [Geminicoccaceae bacterium]
MGNSVMASDVEISGDLRERLTGAVREYLAVRSQGPWPLSTARAIGFVRQRIDAPELDDRLLATLIAEVAVANRLDVSFDGVLH